MPDIMLLWNNGIKLDCMAVASMSNGVMKENLISQAPPHSMSKEERHHEVAVYLKRSCHRLLAKKRQAQFEGSLGDFLHHLRKEQEK